VSVNNELTILLPLTLKQMGSQAFMVLSFLLFSFLAFIAGPWVSIQGLRIAK
jgi:hypothetical protein